jgi:GT2 family glycosyltransferase
MSLAAIIVHFDNSEFTHNAITSAENSKLIQVIVVVLHSEFTHESDHPKSVFIRSENFGYAAGINRAMKHLEKNFPDTTHVIAFNPDLQITPSQVESLLQEHITSGSDCTFPALQEGKLVNHGYRINRFGLLRPSITGSELFSGACFLFSVNTWKKAGEMNEKYFHYFEDIDFCMRMRRAGLKIHHADNIVLNHLGMSGADYPDTELPRYAVRNHLRFLDSEGILNSLSFFSVSFAHFLYLFRWNAGWRGIKAWMKGIQEFRKA